MTELYVRPHARPGQLLATRKALPAIIVLPLRAYADELLPRHQTDGMTRAIIDSLAKLPDIHVINASTALKYRDLSLHPRELGARLGLQYVLSSHVVRVDQEFSFAHTLLDASTGEKLWTDTCPAHVSAFMEFEKKIVSRIINNMVPRIRDAELVRVYRKPMKNRTAYDLMLQALSEIDTLTQAKLTSAELLLDEASRLDQSFASALAWRGRLASIRFGQGWASNREATANLAFDLAARAITLDRDNSLALSTAGHLNSFLKRDLSRGLELLEDAVKACPNDALAWSLSSPTLSFQGRYEEARIRAEHAIWLSPLDPFVFQFYSYAGMALYAQGNYERAASLLRRSYAENPKYTSNLRYLIASLVGLGEVNEARRIRAELHTIEPDFGANGVINCWFTDPALQELYRKQLQTAGI